MAVGTEPKEASVADNWPMIHAERGAIATTVSGLTEEQLSAPSLCGGWSIRDLIGHMISTNETTPMSFYSGLISSGFKFNRFTARGVERHNAGDAATLAAKLEKGTTTTNHPPGPVVAMLGETVIHGEDLRRPLGLSRTVPEASLVAVADFYKKSNLIVGAKRRIAGLHLQATDAEWSTGDGPDVSGPLVSLILAMTGRKAAVGDLSGEGVATLGQRA